MTPYELWQLETFGNVLTEVEDDPKEFNAESTQNYEQSEQY